MRLGIDFGTTRTVVAYTDRGNYPILSFGDQRGDGIDWYPSVVAERDGELLFGFDALAVAADPAYTVLRSFKRLLSDPQAMPDVTVRIGSLELPLIELLTRFLVSLRDAIRTRSNLPPALRKDKQIQATVATPANAHGTQRFVTLDAFRRAGFEVLAMLNEPSAAGFEYTHRHRDTLNSRRENIVVYDLGGGTFDASLVRMSGAHHEAIVTAGVNQLGGDDFDAVLANLVMSRLKLKPPALPERVHGQLLEQCREAKERINPNSRKITVDLEALPSHGRGQAEITIATAEFYRACMPLVERTIEAMAPVVAREGDVRAETDTGLSDVAGIYVVGGASGLPVIARALRERFGRRVHRSPYPSGAIAIGLAIAADESSSFQLVDRFTRYFGVFREGAAGRRVTFDPIFTRDTLLPSEPRSKVWSHRVYHAAHNIGHFRFFECSAIADDGSPHGHIAPFADVLFPFDPALRGREGGLSALPVERMGDNGPRIQEQYAVDEHGIVEVTITNLDGGYERAYRLGEAALSG